MQDNKQTNNEGNIQKDPETGELIGNLKGLRELMRAKEETEVAKTDHRKNRRRNRKNSLDKPAANEPKRGEQANDPQANQERKSSEPKPTDTALPAIDAKQILYAEVELDDKKQPHHIMFYLSDQDQVVTYKDILFAGEKRTKFLNSVYARLESSADHFPRGIYDRVKVYISTNPKITLGYSSLIYDDHFQLKSSTADIFSYIKQIKNDVQPNEPVKDATANNRQPYLTVDQSVELAQIIGHQNFSMDNVIKAIDILGEASDELLIKLYNTGNRENDAMNISRIICELRMDQILGAANSDGKYEILRTDAKALGEGQRRRQRHPRESFLSIIRPVKARGKLIIYDLATLDDPKPADEFMTRLAKLCNQSTSAEIKTLFSDKSSITVNASQVLAAISNDTQELNAIDGYSKFHNIVSKYMLASGWANYFPALLSDIKDIQFLAADLMRYALTNRVWIQPIYTPEMIAIMINAFQDLDVTGVPGIKPLLQALIDDYRHNDKAKSDSESNRESTNHISKQKAEATNVQKSSITK